MLTRLVRSHLIARLTGACLALSFLSAVGLQNAAACPMCKAALASGKGDLVSAYMWSILFLMAMPFTLLGLFSTYCYLQIRRAKAEQAKQQATAASATKPETAPANEPDLVGSSAE